ncbi:unnamed protein product [Leuciscus chuanchicus]
MECLNEMQVVRCSTPEELTELKNSLGDWICDCGVPNIFTASMSDLPTIYGQLVTHFILPQSGKYYPAVHFWAELLWPVVGEEDVGISFEDVLVFVTAADSVPPLGFQQKCKVEFYDQEEPTRRIPYASTCALTLYLPRVDEPHLSEAYLQL